MRHMFLRMVAALALVALAVACAPAAPPPAPTQAPAAPTKAAEPTKPPAAQPTAAPAAPTVAPTAVPAKKIDYPTKGRPVTVMVPYAAGGGTDLDARLLAPGLEKELGTSVEVLNKAGGGTQVGLTELINAKPDGYYIGYTVNPTTVITYLDPDRKAPYSRKSFEPIALRATHPATVTVAANSPYKTLKDLIDDAKARPEGIKVGHSGQMSTNHFAWLQFQKVSGTKFANVFFDGSAPAIAALMGGHVDVTSDSIANVVPKVKNGDLRALAIMYPEQSKFLPGTPTLQSLGYNVNFSSLLGLSAPAGTPKEIIDTLSGAIKRVTESEEQRKKFDDLGAITSYMNPEDYSKMWAEQEGIVNALMKDAKEQAR